MPEPGPTPPPAARSCPACDARRSEWAFVVDGFPHLRCRECGTVFVSPLPSDETIRATYLDPEYHGDVDATEDRMRAEARARARVMKEHGCTRVLEIGCGAGFFVEALLELGIEAEGVDPGPQAQRAAARGLPIRPIWLEELRPTAPYDGIGMFELLEHLPDPITALQWSHRHTFTVFACPMPNSPFVRTVRLRRPAAQFQRWASHNRTRLLRSRIACRGHRCCARRIGIGCAMS